MNKERRKRLREVIQQITEAKYTVEEVKDDEEMAFDSLPESIQLSEKGDQMQENVTALDEVILNLEDVIGSIEDVLV